MPITVRYNDEFDGNVFRTKGEANKSPDDIRFTLKFVPGGGCEYILNIKYSKSTEKGVRYLSVFKKFSIGCCCIDTCEYGCDYTAQKGLLARIADCFSLAMGCNSPEMVLYPEQITGDMRTSCDDCMLPKGGIEHEIFYTLGDLKELGEFLFSDENIVLIELYEEFMKNSSLQYDRVSEDRPWVVSDAMSKHIIIKFKNVFEKSFNVITRRDKESLISRLNRILSDNASDKVSLSAFSYNEMLQYLFMEIQDRVKYYRKIQVCFPYSPPKYREQPLIFEIRDMNRNYSSMTHVSERGGVVRDGTGESKQDAEAGEMLRGGAMAALTPQYTQYNKNPDSSMRVPLLSVKPELVKQKSGSPGF